MNITTHIARLLVDVLVETLLDLKQHCIDYLSKAISCQNTFTLHSLGASYHSNQLTDHANQFMRKNVKEILSRDEFKSLAEDEFCSNLKVVRTIVLLVGLFETFYLLLSVRFYFYLKYLDVY